MAPCAPPSAEGCSKVRPPPREGSGQTGTRRMKPRLGTLWRPTGDVRPQGRWPWQCCLGAIPISPRAPLAGDGWLVPGQVLTRTCVALAVSSAALPSPTTLGGRGNGGRGGGKSLGSRAWMFILDPRALDREPHPEVADAGPNHHPCHEPGPESYVFATIQGDRPARSPPAPPPQQASHLPVGADLLEAEAQ